MIVLIGEALLMLTQHENSLNLLHCGINVDYELLYMN